MYMDDIKLFAKNEKELETLIQVVWIYSQDIGTESLIKKCAMLIMRSEKRHLTDRTVLANLEKNMNARRKRKLHELENI